MVIDVSYILNELEMLEVRLSILDEYVDKFIIVESTTTFSGVEKPMCFDINSERWSKWKDKIEYYVVDDFPLDKELFKMSWNSPNTGGKEHYWLREFYIKESARRALVGLSDDDIVFISDMDEIWNPELTFKPIGGEVLKPKQLPYLYFFNQRTDEDWLGWTGTTCCRYETIKNGIINHIRTDHLQPYTVIEKGGWHFNSIGGKEKKVNASLHPIVNLKSDWDRREINMRIDGDDLPEFLVYNRDKFSSLFI